METFSIHCASVTHAQKGQRILTEHGFSCRIVKTSNAGCGYGLNISAPSRQAALRILISAGVKFSG